MYSHCPFYVSVKVWREDSFIILFDMFLKSDFGITVRSHFLKTILQSYNQLDNIKICVEFKNVLYENANQRSKIQGKVSISMKKSQGANWSMSCKSATWSNATWKHSGRHSNRTYLQPIAYKLLTWIRSTILPKARNAEGTHSGNYKDYMFCTIVRSWIFYKKLTSAS